MTEEEATEACRAESRKHVWPYVPGVFRERFVSPFEQYADRVGQRFTVLKEYAEEELYGEGGMLRGWEPGDTMYRIRFTDGTEIDAWGEEVCVQDTEYVEGGEP